MDGSNSSLRGARLRITLPGNVVYTGVVQSVDMAVPRLSLKVVDDSSGSRQRPRIMNFFGNELNDVEVLDTAQDLQNGDVSPKKNATTVSEVTPSSSTTQIGNNHIEERHNVAGGMSPGFVHSSQSGGQERALLNREDISLPAGGNARHVSREEWLRRVTEEPAQPIGHAPISHRPNIGLPLISDYVYLTEINQQFYDSVAVIMEHMVIGFACEGSEISRRGEISLIQICCRRGIYLFDLVELGRSCMAEGLGEIIHSPDIMKVVHDCRKMSDAIYHILGLKLVNVFDTQVADWMIRRTEAGGMVPMHMNSFCFCLQRYLQLHTFEVHFWKTLRNAPAETPGVWCKRPLPTSLLDAASQMVYYLPALRLVMMESLMAEFVQAIDVYLASMRDAVDGREFSTSEVLPELRKEFAINVGSRNYAAPGRATSPERDGLHAVPRINTHDTRELEACVDSFILENRNDERNMTADMVMESSPPFRDQQPPPRTNHITLSSSAKPEVKHSNSLDSDSSTTLALGLGRGVAVQSITPSAAKPAVKYSSGSESDSSTTSALGLGRGVAVQSITPSAAKPAVKYSSGSESDSSTTSALGLGRGVAVQLITTVRRPGMGCSAVSQQPVRGHGRARMPLVESEPSRPPSLLPSWKDN